MKDNFKCSLFLRQFLFGIIILTAGVALRFWFLPEQLLADDEWHAVHKLLQSDFFSIYQSFGFADHCIPLTLYYKMLTLTTGLSEWNMRLPVLIAGVLAIIVLPLFFRKIILTTEESFVFSGFIAISPILIGFSRIARPYSFSVLFACTALFSFYQWWQRPNFKWGAAYVLATALAAWFHILTLAITLVPFVFFGAISIWSAIKSREFQGVLNLTVIGFVTLFLLSLLLGLPLYNDFHALSAKSGVDFVNMESLWGALSLFVGSANILVILCWSLLVFIGISVIIKRNRVLAFYFLTVILVACFIIISTSGAWIHHSLVLARYLLPILPIFLMLAALGLVFLIKRYGPMYRLVLISSVFVLFYFLGPIPAQYHQPINQFTGHMSYQFDYDEKRNVYNQVITLPKESVPAFYRELEALPENSKTLIVAPWYIEWHWNAWHLYQQVHKQKIIAGFVSGLCVDNTFGEYPLSQEGVEFVNVEHIALLKDKSELAADYFVYHKKYPRQPPASERPDLDFESCEKKIINLLGRPMINDEDMLVYQLNKKLPRDDSGH